MCQRRTLSAHGYRQGQTRHNEEQIKVPAPDISGNKPFKEVHRRIRDRYQTKSSQAIYPWVGGRLWTD